MTIPDWTRSHPPLTAEQLVYKLTQEDLDRINGVLQVTQPSVIDVGAMLDKSSDCKPPSGSLLLPVIFLESVVTDAVTATTRALDGVNDEGGCLRISATPRPTPLAMMECLLRSYLHELLGLLNDRRGVWLPLLDANLALWPLYTDAVLDAKHKVFSQAMWPVDKTTKKSVKTTLLGMAASSTERLFSGPVDAEQTARLEDLMWAMHVTLIASWYAERRLPGLKDPTPRTTRLIDNMVQVPAGAILGEFWSVPAHVTALEADNGVGAWLQRFDQALPVPVLQLLREGGAPLARFLRTLGGWWLPEGTSTPPPK